MVVDDEPDLEVLVRQNFRSKIRNKELEFVFARSGVDALDKLASDGNIDVVLTDINMPEMDGLTLLSKLEESDAVLKTVVVSAYGDMQNIRTAMNRGAFDFVTKPIDFKDLETTIDKSIRELRTLQQALAFRDQLIAIQSELDIATKIQTSILPRTFPPFPDRSEFAIHAKMIPAREVGGDLYDFFVIDDDRIGFVIGDVSGKGVPAAIFMAISRTLIRATALEGVPPNDCFVAANETLVDESLSSMFVTVFYGVLSIRTGALEYCSGGHNPPYLITRAGTVEQLENVGGLLIGAMKGTKYESKTITLQPGDTLFLYTDGVTEAFSGDESEYTEKRLEETLEKLAGRPVEEVVHKVIEDVQAFADGAAQTDDITCLALRYNGT
jgi:sigma-B regulation protein RsbU (phosphoserine phosphatase)